MRALAITLALMVAVHAAPEDPKALEAAVVAAANGSTDEQRAMEGQLLEQLHQASTRDEKSLLCRLLRRVGSSRSVSSLAAMLGNEEDSHMARFALASIPGDQATKAMRESLGNVPETVQAGLMASLAERGDEESLPLFVERLPSEAAIQALGVLGTKEAARELESLRNTANGIGESVVVDDALLKCAERLYAKGRRADARRLYVGAMGTDNVIAAIQGLAEINDLHAKAQVEKALVHPDEEVQFTALRAMIRMLGDDAGSTMLEYLPTAPLAQQAVIVDWLGATGNGAARGALSSLAISGHATLRQRAILALGSVGDASTVAVLLRLLKSDNDDLSRLAETSLIRLQSDDVRDALIAEFRENPSSSLISLLAARRERAALPELLAVCRGEERNLRGAALKAAGSLASSKELPAFVAMLSDSEMKRESKEIESAIVRTFREIPNAEDRAAPLLSAFEEATLPTKVVIVNLLGRTGAANALPFVREALTSDESSLANAAVHTLARWTTAEPINNLYQIAASSKNDGHRVVALRGYVNMAKGLKDAAARYEKAAALAKTPDDKRLILSGLGRTNSLEALKLCQGLLKEPEVGAEAALACIQIARRVWRKSPDSTKALVTSFLQHEDEIVRENAKAALGRMD